MYTLSDSSLLRLKTCHNDLQTVINAVLETYDVTVACGHRGEKAQNEVYKHGLSQLRFPNSNHNNIPSTAIDIYPYINGKMVNGDNQDERLEMCFLGGLVIGIAKTLKSQGKISHSIRWGGAWNKSVLQNSFRDLPHFEIIKD